MADNRRAGERTIFRGDVEGNDTLAEISRALETERRAPVAVGAGFVPPAGGQVSNIPAMADLEDELLREFALYEGPRDPSAREPARKIEPSFEPVASRPAAPAVAAPSVVAPALSDDDDDTMPPMDAGSMFRAARPAPIVRPSEVREVGVAAPARVEPEPPFVFSSEPEAEIDVVPALDVSDSSAAAIDEPVEFSGPVPDLAAWDLEEDDAALEAAVEPAEVVAADPVAETVAEPDDADIEPVFAGPVPDFDFEDEPVFAGPVPEVEPADSMPEVSDEPVFAGPVPDFDFADDDTAVAAAPVETSSVDELEGELEQALGALDLTPGAAAEPASPFAAWKNDRLAAPETTTPAWLSSAALAPKMATVVEDVPVVQAAVAKPHVTEEVVAPAVADEAPAVPTTVEPMVDAIDEFEFELDADDLITPDFAEELKTSPSEHASADLSPEFDEPTIDASKDEPADAAAYVSVEPDVPAFAANPAAALATAAAVSAAPVEPVFDMPDWLQPARKPEASAAPVAEKEADFDFKDFEFDFDEDAIEAEVSRAVMSELHSSAPALAEDELPFDPSAITEIEDRMPASFGNMDVPQVPDTDGETLPKPVSDFDYDIEAEMAELFALGNKSKAQSAEAQVPGGQASSEAGDDDGLANELIRSIHETPAIPAGRAFDMAEINASSTSFVSRYARVAAFAALVAFAGFGAVILWRSGDVPGVKGDGAPRVIMADKSPIKEVPDQPGGKQVPNQDKAVYDRVAGKAPEVVKQGSLIANSEEPVNVAAKTLGDEGTPDAQAPGVSTALAASDADARLPATPSQPGADGQKSNESVTPRKVKTMIVLPNGTLVARETNAPEPEQKPAGADAAMTAPASTAKAEASQPAATIAPADNAPANGAPAAQGVQQATADKAPAAKTAQMPIPTARPAEQPVNVVGTVTQRGNVVGQQTAAAEKPAAQQAPAPVAKPTAQQAAATKPAAAPVAASNAPAGAYVIQIASLPSEAEAQKSYANLSAKFSSVIGGKSPDIKPAEIPGKGTYYRLRIVAGSKDEAIALCSRYKAAGGSCLVSR